MYALPVCQLLPWLQPPEVSGCLAVQAMLGSIYLTGANFSGDSDCSQLGRLMLNPVLKFRSP